MAQLNNGRSFLFLFSMDLLIISVGDYSWHCGWMEGSLQEKRLATGQERFLPKQSGRSSGEIGEQLMRGGVRAFGKENGGRLVFY